MCDCAWEPNTTVEQYNTMMTTISVKEYDVNKQGHIERRQTHPSQLILQKVVANVMLFDKDILSSMTHQLGICSRQDQNYPLNLN